MKTQSINLIAIQKILLSVPILLAFISCSKYTPPKCEKWEVEDAGYIKQGCFIDLGCGLRTLQLSFCGDNLKDAREGNTVKIYETDCCKTTRTFIRRVQ